jgi:cation-transporting ATPase E
MIGIPSFVLALEPNTNRVRGRFLKNVLLRALPAGVTDFLAMLAVILACSYFNIPDPELRTMATIIISAIGVMMLFRVGRPLNALRRALILTEIGLFAISAFFFTNFFTLSALSGTAIKVTVVIAALALPVMILLSLITRRFEGSRKKTGVRSPGRAD